MWIVLAALAAIFTSLGVGLLVTAFVTGEWGMLGSSLFLVVGLVMAWFVPTARREIDAPQDDPPVTGSDTVPFERVAELIRERLANSPYVVEHEGSLIRVHADLADARFLTFAAAHRVKVVRGVEVVATKPGVALMRDFAQDLDLDAGVGRLTGSARVQSGRSWSFERRIEVGMGTDGQVGRQVDVTFSSEELRDPISAVLKQTGWAAPSRWAALPPESAGAAVVAGITIVGLVVVFGWYGVAALIEKLS